ncbi:MAG: hypothetical protein ACK5MN_11720 [Lachnospiraceae bacterium]
MNILITILIGIAGGVGQFFIMRYTLKPLERSENPNIAKLMLLKFPLPLALLVVCGLLDYSLLAYMGGAFCGSLFLSSVINHIVMGRKQA